MSAAGGNQDFIFSANLILSIGRWSERLETYSFIFAGDDCGIEIEDRKNKEESNESQS